MLGWDPAIKKIKVKVCTGYALIHMEMFMLIIIMDTFKCHTLPVVIQIDWLHCKTLKLCAYSAGTGIPINHSMSEKYRNDLHSICIADPFESTNLLI